MCPWVGSVAVARWDLADFWTFGVEARLNEYVDGDVFIEVNTESRIWASGEEASGLLRLGSISKPSGVGRRGSVNGLAVCGVEVLSWLTVPEPKMSSSSPELLGWGCWVEAFPVSSVPRSCSSNQNKMIIPNTFTYLDCLLSVQVLSPARSVFAFTPKWTIRTLSAVPCIVLQPINIRQL